MHRRTAFIGMIILIALSVWWVKPSPVVFQIIDEQTHRPLASRDIYVFDGDIKFKTIGGDMLPYPYGDDAKNRKWFITKLKTDGEGKCLLNLHNIRSQDLLFNVGRTDDGKQSYQLIGVEKSSDIKHTPSAFHLRVAGFKPGTTQVLYNDIYDLTHSVLQRIWLDRRIDDLPYKYVTLVARKAPVPTHPEILGLNQ